jgi:hypothetical protein
MAVDPRAALIMRRLSRLQTQRSTWESHWQELADYMRPRKADIVFKTQTPGKKRTEQIFDGTAVRAAEMLSASLHGMLTNMSTKWFSLRYRDPELQSDDEAREWLLSAEEAMYTAFNRSNFQEQVQELYDDLVVFGTATMMVEPDSETNFRFSTRHIAEIYLAEDQYGRVNTVYRKFRMFARSAIDQFGAKNVSSRILQTEKRDPHEQVDIVHVVMPRSDRDPIKMNSVNMPFASLYIDPEEQQVLSESGYTELPFLCPRWLKSSTELGYGRSCGMTALADTKVLNRMSEVNLRAAQKMTDPPLMVPDDGFMLPIRVVPGGLNFYRSGTRDRLEPLQIGSNTPVALNMEEQRRQAVRSAFYVDHLQLAPVPNETATAVIQRTETSMRMLGPSLGRLQSELLQPLLRRCWSIMSKQEAFPAPPEFLQGNGSSGDIEIEYVSPLARAQKKGDAQSMVQLLEFMGPLMSIDPSIADYLDMDGMAQHLIKALAIPATVVNGEQEVLNKRDERAAQQAQQAEMAEAMQVAQAAGKAAPAIKAVDEATMQEMAGGEALPPEVLAAVAAEEAA